MNENQFKGFGKIGLERTNIKVEPLGDIGSDEVVDMIYEILHQTLHCVMQGDFHGQKMLVLCKMHPASGGQFKFEPVAQISLIIPEYSKSQPQPKGIEMRRVSGGTDAPKLKVVQ